MNPLTDPPRSQGHLTRAPLDRVICQVKFPPLFSLASPEFIGPFQERIRSRYSRPVQNQMIRFQFNIPGNELPAMGQNAMANFLFEDEDQHWRVTLGQDSLSLDTGAYTDRAEFLARLGELVSALEACVHPSHRTRIGVRYVNRIKGEDRLSLVPTVFRPEILGILSSSDVSSHVGQVLTESIMNAAEGRLLARWGLLPANTTYEPLMVPPIGERSWMLDLDAFCEERKPFNSVEIMADATALTERNCAFFQWATTEAFVTHFR